jgi:hypothetical protein
MNHGDPRESSLSWLREELAKLGVKSYIIPANDSQGPSLHCGWGEGMVTVNMCYGDYLFLSSTRLWVKVSGNRPQECVSKILGEEPRGGGTGI